MSNKVGVFTLISSRNCLPLASTWVHPKFFCGSVLLIFIVFCVVLLFVFMFWVPCWDVRYDFRIKTMFGSSLPPVICGRAHVLFVLFAHSGVQHILCCFSSYCVPCVASFSGLSIFNCFFGILWCLLKKKEDTLRIILKAQVTHYWILFILFVSGNPLT